MRCPFGHGYHVNAEAVLLEVVDANGLPVPPGEPGRAVITPFASTALPLIRYDQGDIVIAGTTCECGRALPHLEAISGRGQASCPPVFPHKGSSRDILRRRSRWAKNVHYFIDRYEGLRPACWS